MLRAAIVMVVVMAVPGAVPAQTALGRFLFAAARTQQQEREFVAGLGLAPASVICLRGDGVALWSDMAVRNQGELHLAGLLEVRRRLQAKLGELPPWRFALFRDELAARRATNLWCGHELQGLAAVDPVAQVAVIQVVAALRDDAVRHRAIVHAAAHLAFGALVPPDRRDELGYGWLDEGLAHWCEAEFAGVCEHNCVRGQLQAPIQFYGGYWRLAARSLLTAGRLPALADLLATEASDFDLEQHAASFALTEFLLRSSAPPVTHQAAGPTPPLQIVVQAARAGRPAAAALTEALGAEPTVIEQRFRVFVKESPER